MLDNEALRQRGRLGETLAWLTQNYGAQACTVAQFSLTSSTLGTSTKGRAHSRET